jgi:hypothetical protein
LDATQHNHSFDWIKYAYYFQYLTFGPLGSSKKSDRLDKDEYISEQYLFSSQHSNHLCYTILPRWCSFLPPVIFYNIICVRNLCSKEFEDTKGVIRIHKSNNTMAKRKKDKQRSTKYTHKTNDRVTRTPLKTRSPFHVLNTDSCQFLCSIPLFLKLQQYSILIWTYIDIAGTTPSISLQQVDTIVFLLYVNQDKN